MNLQDPDLFATIDRWIIRLTVTALLLLGAYKLVSAELVGLF